MAAKNSSKEIRITRIYDAPIKVVWEAWTDPRQAAKWWGPRGFTLTTHSKDLRTGGSWNYTMHGPDGVDYPNKTQYLEVEKYSRLVYDHGANDDQPPMFRVTVNFSEVKGKTKMEMSMGLPTAEAAEEARKFIKKAGGNSTWDRLAEYLEKESTGKEQFVINRSFNTSIETMFKMWTDPKHLGKWMGPAGSTIDYIKADIRPGGGAFYCMTYDGGKIYGRTEILEISKPHRYVYTQQFCDENQKVIRHPMAPTWPETIKTILTLAEEGSDQTRVTVTWQIAETVTPEELATFVQGRAGMTGGWTGSFDKLEEYLTE